MRSYRLIFFCILFYSAAARAQTAVDSFEATIGHYKTYDAQIKAYILFGEKIGLQNFDDAIRIGEEGLKLAEKKADSASAGQLRRQIGEACYFKGNYDEAAKLFFRSISALEKTKEKDALAKTYNALAKLYRKTRDLDQSLENYDKAMALYRSLNDSAGIASIYNESGVVFEYRKEYDKAIERYGTSLRIDEIRKDSIGICYALSNLAGVYTLQNKFPEAEKYLYRSLAYRQQMNDSFALILNYSDLGSVYFSAGQPEKAKAFLDTSNRLAEIMNYPELKSTNYELLSQIEEKQGNYKAALEYDKKKTMIRDSLFSIEKTKQIQELNTRYETEKKELKIREQQDKIGLQNILMIAAIILVLLGSLLAYAQYRKYQWRQEAKTQAQILRQQDLAAKAVMEAEEAERRRIATDLHDGVGQTMSAAMMNLSAYEHRASFPSEEERASFSKIISLVDAGCKEVRAVSHNMMPNALLNNNLDAAIREFIDKIDARSLKVHFYSEGFHENFDANIETVLYRIIQECVNNVIKHSGADTLDISLIKENAEITATIEDNGKGFDMKQYNEGIGLKNIRTRIEYLKGTVDFKSAPGQGTLVALHIPVNG